MRDYIVKPIRSAAILTGSYVAGTSVILEGKYNKATVLLDFTKGSLTTAEIKFEFSGDGTNWYQEVASSTTSGTTTDTLVEHQISATGKYRLPVNVTDRYMRASVKGTGTATSSSMAIQAVLTYLD